MMIEMRVIVVDGDYDIKLTWLDVSYDSMTPLDGWLVDTPANARLLQMWEGLDHIYSISRMQWIEKIRRKSTKAILAAYH